MLVQCQGCGSRVSDTAAACPKCEVASETLLGPPAPCRECGHPYRPAYDSCLSCGAPCAIASPAVVHTHAPSEPVEKSQTSPDTDPGTLLHGASNRIEGSETGEAIYVSLVPIRSQSGSLRWALNVYLVALLLVIGLQLTTLWLADSVKSGSWLGPVSVEQLARTIDSVAVYLNFGAMASFVLSAILYCQFLYRALKELAGAPAITLSPLFGVVATFIPILNLWVPYRAITQIWRASHGFAERPASPPAAIGWWWLCWILSGLVLAGADMAARQQSSSFEAIVGANMFGNVLLVVATIELKWITQRIAEAFDVGRKLLGYRES